jgi:hypothetical protein
MYAERERFRPRSLLSRGHALYDPCGMFRVTLTTLVLVLFASGAEANGSLSGKLDLPPAPERKPPEVKGFTDRLENALAPVRPTTPTSEMVVVLFGSEKLAAPPQVVIELLGESFSRRVAAVPAGSEVVIRNVSKTTARSLSAAEDPKLVPPGPINPSGPKSFRVEEADKVYTIGDPEAPHLKLKLVVVNTLYYGYPDDNGKFVIDGVPAGSYKVKIWYRDGWLERPADTVEIGAKGKTEFNPKVASLAPGKK